MIHAIIEFFRRLGAAWRTVRGKERPRPQRTRPAPFCTVCGERTRPYDPEDEQRHAHDGASEQDPARN